MYKVRTKGILKGSKYNKKHQLNSITHEASRLLLRSFLCPVCLPYKKGNGATIDCKTCSAQEPTSTGCPRQRLFGIENWALRDPHMKLCTEAPNNLLTPLSRPAAPVVQAPPEPQDLCWPQRFLNLRGHPSRPTSILWAMQPLDFDRTYGHHIIACCFAIPSRVSVSILTLQSHHFERRPWRNKIFVSAGN